MPSFATHRTVRHAASAMFALVADVERYPEFVPLCTKLTIRSERDDGDLRMLLAEMTVASGPIRETFTSSVALDRAALAIRTETADGPFRRLTSAWSFAPLDDDTSSVRFAIDYEFRSRVFAAMMGGVFERSFHAFADAFEARADAVYGRDAIARS
jgi:coenzyme Q-binding protein COQ10